MQQQLEPPVQRQTFSAQAACSSRLGSHVRQQAFAAHVQQLQQWRQHSRGNRACAVQRQRAFAAQQQQQLLLCAAEQRQPQQQGGQPRQQGGRYQPGVTRRQGLSGVGVMLSSATTGRPHRWAVACRHRLVVRFASRALCKRPQTDDRWVVDSQCVVAPLS
jgi:hypothetical protein